MNERPSAEHDDAPRSIGPYTIQGVLGSGGMGCVYRAVAPDQTRVALKVVQPRHVRRDTLLRFERESAIRIEHPNVVQVLDAGTADDGSPYLAIELLEGCALDEVVRQRTLTPAEVRDFGMQACAGLAAVHRQGLVHRDLKPANLFWCRDGTIKILDFGVARVATAPTLTRTGAVVGTISYLSPEQARASNRVDARSDIWSLGALLYEALTGTAPFDRDSAVATLLAIMTDRLPPLRERVTGLSHRLASVLEQCLAKEADARWDSAEALQQALEQADAGEGGQVEGVAGDAFAETVHSVGSLRPDEQRVVAVLLAQGVEDFAALRDASLAAGGTPIPLLEHGVVSIFGGERWEGDETARAVRVALTARHAAERVAVSTGRAQAAGNAISGAALEAAEQGCRMDWMGVAVDRQTARVLRGFLRGEAHEHHVEVIGEQAEGQTIEERGDHQVPPPVGRDRELSVLQGELQNALSERQPRLCAVYGAPGIGKSRLLHAFEQAVSGGGSTEVLTVEGQPLNRQTGLAFLASGLGRFMRRAAARRGWPRLDAGASSAEQRHAVATLGKEAGLGARSEHLSFLGELLGVPMPQTATLRAARGDPQLMLDRIRLAVQALLEGWSRVSPLVLLLDDIQWADAQSLQLLGEIGSASVPMVMVASARVEEGERLPSPFDAKSVERVPLTGLDAPSCESLVTRVFGDPPPEGLVEALRERSEGNPLFLEQMALELREQHGDAPWAPDEFPLPATVEAVVQSRFDRLPALEREVCKRAALFERAFSVEDLSALGLEQAGPAVQALVARNILQPTFGERATGDEFVFRNILLQHVASAMLAPELRSSLHHRIALHLHEQGTSSAEELARHYELGGAPAEAGRWYTEATLASLRLADMEAVLRHAGRALAQPLTEEGKFELEMARAEAFSFLGERDEQAKALERAEGLAQDAEQCARLFNARTTWLSHVGRLQDAIAVSKRAVQCAEECRSVEVLAGAYGRQAQVLLFSGSFEEAAHALKESGTLASAVDLTAQRAQVAEWRGLLAAAQGDIGKARAGFEEAVALHAEAGNVRGVAANQNNLADTSNRLGDYESALAALEDALDGFQRLRLRSSQGYALANLAYAQLAQGTTAGALESLTGASEIAEATRDVRLEVAVRIYTVRALLDMGANDDARDEAAEAIRRAQEAEQPGLTVMARIAAARVELRLNEPEKALDRAQRAMEQRDQLGGVEEDEGEVFLVLAEALEACGYSSDASQVRARGRDRLREVADRITDPELRRGFMQEVPWNRKLLADAAAAQDAAL